MLGYLSLDIICSEKVVSRWCRITDKLIFILTRWFIPSIYQCYHYHLIMSFFSLSRVIVEDR